MPAHDERNIMTKIHDRALTGTQSRRARRVHAHPRGTAHHAAHAAHAVHELISAGVGR